MRIYPQGATVWYFNLIDERDCVTSERKVHNKMVVELVNRFELVMRPPLS